jgi:PAS domain S-box-containing protein
MRIRNVKRWAPGGVRSYAIAVAAIMIAFAVRFALQPVLTDRYAFLFFAIAALLVEFFAGLGPALLVVASGLVIGGYFFVPPFNSLGMPEGFELVVIAFYLVVAMVGIILIESLQRSRYEARLLHEVAQSRLEMLERSHGQRLQAEEAARQSEERFQALASGLPQVWYMRRLDGNFEYVNDQFYQYTGLAPGSLEENGWLKAIHPDDVERVKSEWNRIAETGGEQSSRFRLRMADESYRYFAGQLSCIQDQRGKIIKWAGVSTELSS